MLQPILRRWSGLWNGPIPVVGYLYCSFGDIFVLSLYSFGCIVLFLGAFLCSTSYYDYVFSR
jgi:hypothetical protein